MAIKYYNIFNAVPCDIIPRANNSIDLGSTALKLAEGHFYSLESQEVTVDAHDLTIETTTSGDIILDSADDIILDSTSDIILSPDTGIVTGVEGVAMTICTPDRTVNGDGDDFTLSAGDAFDDGVVARDGGSVIIASGAKANAGTPGEIKLDSAGKVEVNAAVGDVQFAAAQGDYVFSAPDTRTTNLSFLSTTSKGAQFIVNTNVGGSTELSLTSPAGTEIELITDDAQTYNEISSARLLYLKTDAGDVVLNSFTNVVRSLEANPLTVRTPDRTVDGDGQNTTIAAGDAFDSGATPRNGGNVYITAGDAVNGGTNGAVNFASSVGIYIDAPLLSAPAHAFNIRAGDGDEIGDTGAGKLLYLKGGNANHMTLGRAGGGVTIESGAGINGGLAGNVLIDALTGTLTLDGATVYLNSTGNLISNIDGGKVVFYDEDVMEFDIGLENSPGDNFASVYIDAASATFGMDHDTATEIWLSGVGTASIKRYSGDLFVVTDGSGDIVLDAFSNVVRSDEADPLTIGTPTRTADGDGQDMTVTAGGAFDSGVTSRDGGSVIITSGTAVNGGTPGDITLDSEGVIILDPAANNVIIEAGTDGNTWQVAISDDSSLGTSRFAALEYSYDVAGVITSTLSLQATIPFGSTVKAEMSAYSDGASPVARLDLTTGAASETMSIVCEGGELPIISGGRGLKVTGGTGFDLQVYADAANLQLKTTTNGDIILDAFSNTVRTADGDPLTLCTANRTAEGAGQNVTISAGAALAGGAPDYNGGSVTIASGTKVGGGTAGDITLDSAGDVILDAADEIIAQSNIIVSKIAIGSTQNSRILEFDSNYFNVDTNYEHVAQIQLMGGADPYLRFSVSDGGVAPTTTAVFDMHDTVIAFCQDGTVDIGGATDNRPKDIHAKGVVEGVAALKTGSTDALPVASATYRGQIRTVFGAGGARDRVYACLKGDAEPDAYSWVEIVNGGA